MRGLLRIIPRAKIMMHGWVDLGSNGKTFDQLMEDYGVICREGVKLCKIWAAKGDTKM